MVQQNSIFLLTMSVRKRSLSLSLSLFLSFFLGDMIIRNYMHIYSGI